MKAKILLFTALAGFQILSFGQTSMEKRLRRISTPHYQPLNEDSNLINIPMDFNDMKPNAKLNKIQLDKIQSISLVYTKFKVSETFDQLNLNNQRVQYLYSVLPGLKEKKNIQWIWVEQTGCTDAGMCRDYYHGLVIKLKSEEDKFSSAVEAASLKYYMDLYEGKTMDTKTLDSLSTLPESKITKKCITHDVRERTTNRIGKPKTWNGDVKSKILKALAKDLKTNGNLTFNLHVNKKGLVTSLAGTENLTKKKKIEELLSKELKFTKSRYNRKFVDTDVILNIYRLEGKTKCDFISKPVLPEGIDFNIDSFNFVVKSITTCDYVDVTKNFSYSSMEKPVVINVLDRNKKWKNCLIATDVTGSMSPYLGQFAFWHKLNLNASKNNKFVFFNDGDNMSDDLKVAGNVGGLYTLATKDFSDLWFTLLEAQRNGGGGDGPENNLEAVIKGLKDFPECEGVIMVADNWATPRDLELLKQIKVPMHIILCGTGRGINSAYLDLAYKNSGSIHTIENDIIQLSKLKENEEIVIENKTFKLSDGKFILTK